MKKKNDKFFQESFDVLGNNSLLNDNNSIMEKNFSSHLDNTILNEQNKYIKKFKSLSKEELSLHQKFLTDEVAKHAYNYYVLDKPTISDKEYDVLYDELVAIEKYTNNILPNSVTQRVGGEILKGFKKYSHKYRLYSMDKCQSKEELAKWVNGIKKIYPEATFTCEYKFDGLSLVCTYKDGYFVSAGTRGNGFIGEDVTEQAKTIKTVPLKINFKGELIVQGEAMILLSNLEKYNKTATEPLKNARNAAAGAIRNLNPKETAKRNLNWFAYTIHYAENKKFNSQIEMFDFLKENGFDIGNYCVLCKTTEEIFKQIDFIESEKSKIGNLYVYPFLGYTYLGERKGYMLVPDGNGALINLEDKEGRFSMAYSQKVYGSDIGIDSSYVLSLFWDSYQTVNDGENIMAPVYGMVHTDSDMGYLAIIESGAEAATIEAYPNGAYTNYNWISAKFMKHTVYTQPTSKSGGSVSRVTDKIPYDIQIRYNFVGKGEADYTGLAKSYRQYLLKEGGLEATDHGFKIRLDFLGTERENWLFFKRAVIQFSQFLSHCFLRFAYGKEPSVP